MTVNLQFDGVLSAQLNRLLRAADGGRIAKVAGQSVTNLTRGHFEELQRTRPNRLGGRRTNFWADALRGTSLQVVDRTKAKVNIATIGVRQRLEGGVIRAGRSINPKTGRPTNYLAIPLTPDAYGKRPAERSDLDFQIVPGIGPALVEARATEIRIRKKKDGTRSIRAVKSRTGIVPLYRLVRKVTQKADPTVLPSVSKMQAAATTGALLAIGTALRLRR